MKRPAGVWTLGAGGGGGVGGRGGGGGGGGWRLVVMDLRVFCVKAFMAHPNIGSVTSHRFKPTPREPRPEP